MLRSVVDVRGPVAMILATLTGTWGDVHVPSVDRRRCPRHDRGGDAARVPLARVRLRHVVVRHADFAASLFVSWSDARWRFRSRTGRHSMEVVACIHPASAGGS